MMIGENMDDTGKNVTKRKNVVNVKSFRSPQKII